MATAVDNVWVSTVVSGSGKVSLHSASPGTTGANEIAYTGYSRQVVTFSSNTGTVTFTISGSGAASYWGIWTSGGTYLDGGPLPSGGPTFPGSSPYSLTVGPPSATSNN